jgi:hypothetical protein
MEENYLCDAESEAKFKIYGLCTLLFIQKIYVIS